MLREASGKTAEKISLNDSDSARDLISKVVELNNNRFRELILDSKGKIRNSFVFAVNGDTIPYSRLRSLRSRDISEFAILPPISGG
jgi:molybdopterin converting factor small subunit